MNVVDVVPSDHWVLTGEVAQYAGVTHKAALSKLHTALAAGQVHYRVIGAEWSPEYVDLAARGAPIPKRFPFFLWRRK
jgi:hypothetical protein